MIEQVMIKKTLKAGSKVWLEGEIVNPPLPDVLLEEVRFGTGTVEVLKETGKPATDKLIFVAKKVDERPKSSTTTSMQAPPAPPPKPAKVVSGKPLLKRRK